MTTECPPHQLEFHSLGRRDIVARCDGGEISSNGGGLLLREVEQRTHLLHRLSQCCTDYRDQDRREHSLESLVTQRGMGLVLGYEDLNDHDEVRTDRVLALLSDCRDLAGADRARPGDRGTPLAGTSTLNRLELSPLTASAGSRSTQSVADTAAMDALLVDLFLESHDSPPAESILRRPKGGNKKLLTEVLGYK